MDKEYGIGIVGCGNISETHAEAIQRTDKGRLVAAHSRTEAALESFCDSYNISACSTYEDFLAYPELDVVVICTPTGTHGTYGKQAAEAGKHVVVEKPIEITVKRGRGLIQSCRSNGVNLAVIYQSRFIDEVTRMKKEIDKQHIGQIVMASASVKWFRSQSYYNNSSWRGTFELDGGGAVINQSIHTIDLLQWLVGRVEAISAFKGTFTQGMEAEDNAVASIKFKNGAIGVFEASTSITPPQDRKIEINGARGTLLLEGDTFTKKLDGQEDSGEVESSSDGAGSASPLAGMTWQNHKIQYDQILNAFLNDNEPTVSGEESLQSLAIVEALYASTNMDEIVYIDDVLSGEMG